MPVLEHGVMPETVINESVAELRSLWLPWVTKTRRARMLVNPEKRGVSQENLTGQKQHDIEMTRQYMSQYVSGRLANIHRSALGRFMNGKPVFRTAVIADEAVEQDRQQTLERVCQGLLSEQNLKSSQVFRGTSWLRQVARDVLVNGKAVGRVQVMGSPKDKTLMSVDWPLYDPLACYHDFDSWPRRFVREFRTNSTSARRILLYMGLPVPNGVDLTEANHSVVMTEFWIEEQNEDFTYDVHTAMLVEGKVAGLPKKSDCARMPIIVSCANAERGTFGIGSTQAAAPQGLGFGAGNPRGVSFDEVNYHAQSLYSTIEHIHNMFEEGMSKAMDSMNWALNKALLFHSVDGQWVLGPDKLGPGSRNPVADERGQKIEAVDAPIEGLAEYIRVFDDIISKEFNILYNAILLGQSTPGDSGFKVTNLISHAESILMEEARAIAAFLHMGLIEIFEQWRQSPQLEILFKGKTSSGVEAGHIAIERFKFSDMPEQYALEVEVSPDIPKDTMAAMNYAIQGLQSGVLDMDLARQSVAIEDPKSVQDRLDAWKLASSPQMMSVKLLQAMNSEYQEARRDAARNPNSKVKGDLAAIYQRMYEATEAQLMGGGEQAQPQPPAQIGIPPEAGGTSDGMADETAIAQGRPNAYMGGRPATPASAAANGQGA